MIIGIIGLGYMGMIHAKNLLAMGHEVYGQDTDIFKIGKLIEIGGHNMDGYKLYGDLDAVVIATPMSEHFSNVADCLFKARPILVEKPIFGHGGSGSKWDGVCSLTEPDNPVVMVGNNMRYHPVVKVVKERMHELGGNYNGAWFRLHQQKGDAKDPVILNWGSHEVDLALYLLDKKLTVMQGHSKVEHDRAEFILRYSSGPLVHMDLSYHGPDERCFTIHGPDASIHADLDNFTVHIFSRYGREVIAVEGSHEDSYKAEMREFIRRVEGKPSDGVGATGAEGLACLKLLLEASHG